MASKTEEKQAANKGQSWKPVNDTTASRRRARRLRWNRALWTSIVLVLASVLFYLLLSPFYFDRPQVFCLAVSEYEVLGPTPPAYSREDFAKLNDPLKDVLYADSKTDPGFHELPPGQTASALENLKDQIQGSLHGSGLLRNRDVLIVYLRAQGISDNGVPYLLGSDFDPEHPTTGRVELRTVLDQLKACTARIKLLLLDSGDLTYAPRLGLMVNEFPRLAERIIAKTEDKSLWVLCSHSSLERSNLIIPYRRSVFGYFASGGLAGAADIDGNNNVSLRELAGYVIDRTSSWVQEYSGGADTQTPMLVWAGGRRTTFTPTTTLVTVDPKSRVPAAQNTKTQGTGEATSEATGARTGEATPKPAATAGQPATPALPATNSAVGASSGAPSRGNATRPSGADVGRNLSLAWLTSGPVMWASYLEAGPEMIGPEPPPRLLVAQATPAATGAAAPTTAAAPVGTGAAPAAAAGATPAGTGAVTAPVKPAIVPLPERTAETVALEQLIEAWQLHDALQTRGPNNRWSPADYAPHLWREFEETLIAYEQRLLGGKAFDSVQIGGLINKQLLPLRCVIEGRPMGREVNPASVAHRLYSERPRFIPGVDHPHSLAAAPVFAWPPGAETPKHLAAVAAEWKVYQDAQRSDGFAAWAHREGTAHPDIAETVFVSRLADHMDGLDWDRVKKFLRGLRMAEEVAAAGEWVKPWIEKRLAEADRLGIAGKKEVLGEGRDVSRAEDLLHEAETKYAELYKDVTTLRRARALQADLTHRAPYYLYWRATAGRTPDEALVPQGNDLDNLLSGLHSLNAKLASPNPDRIGELKPIVDQLLATRRSIERHLQPDEIDPLTNVPRSENGTPAIDFATAHRVHVLLSVPLASSEVRLKLINFMLEQNFTPPSLGRPQQNAPKTHQLTDADWVEVRDRAEREVALLRLTAGVGDDYFSTAEIEAAITGLERAYARWVSLANNKEVFDRDDVIWTAYRSFGNAIRIYYASLARDVGRIVRRNMSLTDPAKRPEQMQELLRAARGLQLVAACDARVLQEANPIEQLRQAEFRDFLVWHQMRFWKQTEAGGVQRDIEFLSDAAKSYHDQAALIPNQPAPPALPERSVPLEFEGPTGLVMLRPDAPANLQILVRPSREMNAEAWVMLKYNPNILEVRPPAEFDAPVEKRRRDDTDLPERRPRFYHLHQMPADPDLLSEPSSFVLTKPETPQMIRLDVSALATSETPTPLTVIVKADGVEAEYRLEIQPPYPERYKLLFRSAGTSQPAGGGQLLMPFPNAVTPFPMSLQNVSQQDGKIRVKLVALPALYIGEARRLDWPLDEEGKSLDPNNPEAVLSEIPSMTVPAGQTVPLIFPPPKAAIVQKPATPEAPAPMGAAAPPKPAEPEPPEVSQGMALVIHDFDQKRTRVHRLLTAAQKPSRYLKPTVRFNEVSSRVEVLIEPYDRDVLPPEGSTVKWEIGDQVPEGTTILLEGKITAPDYRVLLFAEAPENPGRVMDVVLTVDGYPRAFTYHQRTAAGVAPATLDEGTTEIRLTAPKAGTLYKAPVASIPVTFEVDAPPDAFQDIDDVLEVGFDLDFDRTLNGERTWRFYSERMARIGLKGYMPDGGLALTTKVGDFSFNLETPQVQNAKAAIMARMMLNGEPTYSNEVEIRLDSAGPKILQTGYLNAVVGTESVAYAMTAADELGDVEKVEVSVDPLNRGVFGATAPITAERNQAGKWVAAIPTKAYAVGSYQVLARGVDFAGNQGPVTSTMLEITPPPAPPIFTINGIVYFEKAPSADVEVLLEVEEEKKPEPATQGTGQPKPEEKPKYKTIRTTRSDDLGRFRFDDVKPGKYYVNAHAIRKNKDRKAERVEVTLTEQTKAAPFVRLTIANP